MVLNQSPCRSLRFTKQDIGKGSLEMEYVSLAGWDDEDSVGSEARPAVGACSDSAHSEEIGRACNPALLSESSTSRNKSRWALVKVLLHAPMASTIDWDEMRRVSPINTGQVACRPALEVNTLHCYFFDDCLV